MHLDERGHAETLGAVEQRGEHVLLECRDDQQDDVGAVGASLVDLVRADDEVLAQHGDVDTGAHGVQVGERPTEPTLLGEDADDARTTGFVRGGEVGWIRDVGELTLGRTRSLHLCDDADSGLAQRSHRIARSRRGNGRLFDGRVVDDRLARGDIGFHSLEN
ncbi:Uncharacterised protein [Mycobacteroides abscessus subsp. abscessus]|nr:Uncharacterised protein [Mycobacteroides abscessus subsp. abscessus]